MDESPSDPDFIPPRVTLKELHLDESFESSDSSRSDRSRSLTPFLRSSCHQHKGPCNEGHGIEFHSRISPSPNRSYHRRRRRRSLQISGDTNNSTSLRKEHLEEMSEAEKETTDKDNPLKEIELEQLREMAQPILATSTPLAQHEDTSGSLTVNRSMTSNTSHHESKGRRNLMKDFSTDLIVASSSSQSKVSSSSSTTSNENDKGYDQWVTRMVREKTQVETSYIVDSNISARSLTRKRFLEKKQPALPPSSRKKNLESPKETDNSPNTSFSSRNATVSSGTIYQDNTLYTPSMTDSSTSGGSPRLKAFDGRRWIWSERTGYTYTMSPSYRNEWTPEREKLTTPMPHMARLPIHAYNDGEVSFHSPVLISSAKSRQLSFSSDEEAEEGDEFLKWTNKSKYGQNRNICRRFMIKLITLFNFLLWLLLSPILYPLKLTYEGSKSCYYATKKIDFSSIPRYVSSVLISSTLSSANIISMLGHSAQNSTYVFVLEIIRKTSYIYKFSEQLLKRTGQNFISVWHRIKEEYHNFFNNVKETRDTVNASTYYANENEKKSDEYTNAKHETSMQKISSFLLKLPKQLLNFCSSTSSFVYSSLRDLITRVVVICKTVLMWSISIITAPLLLMKGCIIKLFIVLKSSTNQINNSTASSTFCETDHLTNPSEDTFSTKIRHLIFTKSSGPPSSSITTNNSSSHVNDGNKMQNSCINDEGVRQSNSDVHADQVKDTHAHRIITSNLNEATDKTKSKPAFSIFRNVMQSRQQDACNQYKQTETNLQNKSIENDTQKNTISKIGHYLWNKTLIFFGLIAKLFSPVFHVLQFLYNCIHKCASVVLFSVLSAFSFPRIIGGCDSSLELQESSNELNINKNDSIRETTKRLQEKCTYPFKVILFGSAYILCWPVKKLFTSSTSSANSTKEESELFNETQDDEELVHEFIINKVTTYIYKFSNLIWKKKTVEEDKKKKVRFPDGLNTPKIIPGYSINQIVTEQSLNGTYINFGELTGRGTELQEGPPSLPKTEPEINNVDNPEEPLTHHSNANETNKIFPSSQAVFKKVSLLNKVVKFFSLTRTKRRRKKYFREGYRKSLRLKGLPAENDGLRDIKRKRRRRILRKSKPISTERTSTSTIDQTSEDVNQLKNEDEYEEISEDDESEDEEERIGVLEWFYDRFIGYEVDIDTEEDDSYCSEDIREFTSTGEFTDTANISDSIEQPCPRSWIYTISKLLLFPFILVKETVLKICKVIVHVYSSLVSTMQRFYNQNRTQMQCLDDEQPTRYSLRLRGINALQTDGVGEHVRRRTMENTALEDTVFPTNSHEDDGVTEYGKEFDKVGEKRRSLYNWVTTGWFGDSSSKDSQQRTTCNREDNQDDGFYSDEDGMFRKGVMYNNGLPGNENEKSSNCASIVSPADDLNHMEAYQDADMHTLLPQKSNRRSQRGKKVLPATNKLDSEYEADIEGSEEDESATASQNRKTVLLISNDEGEKIDDRCTEAKPKYSASESFKGLSSIAKTFIPSMTIPSSVDGFEVFEQDHHSVSSNTQELNQSHVSNETTEFDDPSSLEPSSSYLSRIISFPFTFLWFCISSVFSFLNNHILLSLFPNKEIRRKRRSKSLPEEHPSRVSLRLRGFNAENTGIVLTNRTRTRKRNENIIDSDTISNTTGGDIDVTEQDLGDMDDVEQVNFFYWMHCKVLGKLSEDNYIDDDAESIAGLNEPSESREGKSILSSVLNNVKSCFAGGAITFYSIGAHLLRLLVMALSCPLFLLTSLKEIFPLRNNEPNVQKQHYSSQQSQFGENLGCREEAKESYESIHERRYNAFSDTDEEHLGEKELIISTEPKQPTSGFSVRAATFACLKWPFSLAESASKQLLSSLQSALQMVSSIQIIRKSKTLIIQKEEDPERMSRRLRGIEPDKFNMTTNRRRSKRHSASSLNVRGMAHFDDRESIKEALSSDEEFESSSPSCTSKVFPRSDTHSKESILTGIKTSVKYIFTGISVLFTSTFKTALTILNAMLYPFRVASGFLSKCIELATGKGKVTTIEKEEHPTRLSRRLRGRPAEQYGDLPGAGRRVRQKASQRMEHDAESLLDDSDLEDTDTASIHTLLGNEGPELPYQKPIFSASNTDSEKISWFTIVSQKITSAILSICSILVSPFRLAYFGFEKISSQQSMHKKKNRRRTRAFRDEHPSRQSLRLRGRDADNDVQLPSSKRISRSRRSRFINIQPLDFPEHDEYNEEKYLDRDDDSIITNLDEEEEQSSIGTFLPFIILLLVLPLAAWLCYGVITVGPQAVLEQTFDAVSHITEYSSQIIVAAYHWTSETILTAYEYTRFGLSSVYEGVFNLWKNVFNQFLIFFEAMWSWMQHIGHIFQHAVLSKMSVLQAITPPSLSDAFQFISSIYDYICSNLAPLFSHIKSMTSSVISAIPQLDWIWNLPNTLWNFIGYIASIPLALSNVFVQFVIYVASVFKVTSDSPSILPARLSEEDVIAALLKSPSLQNHIKNIVKASSEEQDSKTNIQIQASHARIVNKLEKMYSDVTFELGTDKNSVDEWKIVLGKRLSGLTQDMLNMENVFGRNQGEMDKLLKENENIVSKLREEFDVYRENLRELQLSVDDEPKDIETSRNLIEEKLKSLEDKIKILENEIAFLKVEAKKCCDKKSNAFETVNTNIDKQILKLLEETLNNKTESVKNETNSAITTEYLHAYLNNSLAAVKQEVLSQTKKDTETLMHGKIKEHIDNYLKEFLQNTKHENENINNVIMEKLTNKFNLKNATKERNNQIHEDIAVGLNRSQVESIVRNALVRYDADKTGVFDFALETSGGSVVSTRCTQTYVERSGTYTMFGGWVNLGWFWPLRMSTTSPRNAIQPGVQPGQCWAFKGNEGRLLIALSSPMIPRRFSIEHIPRSLSPNGRIDSAPRHFMVHGLMAEFDKEPVKLGEYEYDAVNGEPLQMFEVNMDEDKTKNFKLIEVEIKSNHGHPEYTCLYRFRVHGN